MSISPTNQTGDADVPKNPGDRMHEEGDEVTLSVDAGVADIESGDWLVLGDDMNVTAVAAFTGTSDPAPEDLAVAKKPASAGEDISAHFRGNIRAEDTDDTAWRPYPAIQTWADGSALFIVR